MMETYNYYQNPEYRKALIFLEKGCKCGCSKQIPEEKFAKWRVQFQKLPKPSQDAFVMGQLSAMNEGINKGDMTTSSRYPKRERTKVRIFYRWNNKIFLCRATYLELLGVGQNYLKDLAHTLINEGLEERIHGNTGRTPQWKTKTAISQEVKKTAKRFIENYAEKNGFPNPGRTKRANKITIFLPTEMTYKSVHQEFLTSLEKDNHLKSLKYEAFRRLWHQLTPHIKFLNPRTDLCDTCRQFRNELHSCQDETTKTQIKKNLIPSRKS